MPSKFLAVVTIILLFARGGVSQCYTDIGCSGTTIAAANARECCIGTDDGLAFSENGICIVCIVSGFRQAVYDVAEDSRLVTDFDLNIKGTSNLSGLVITGTITAAADGTASTSDFQTLDGIRVLGNSANIELFTTNDEITLEYDDRISLNFSPDDANIITFVENAGEYIRDKARVNIIDNDELQINFVEADYSVTEGAQSNITIGLQFRQTQNDFTITFKPVTITEARELGAGFSINSVLAEAASEATADADFTSTPKTYTVTDHGGSFQISQFFTVVDDDIDERTQLFVLLAEIGQDVPTNTSCFQISAGRTGCFGRRGGTVIIITDNDPMVIGFTARGQTVSEADVPDGFTTLTIPFEVDTERLSERELNITFRLLPLRGEARVDPSTSVNNETDAIFGARREERDPIEELFVLKPLAMDIDDRQAVIIDDFEPEGEECFVISIVSPDIPGVREIFTCNSPEAESYFCSYEMCIVDDDEPFRVGFVEKTYTVDESVGAVNVCVNLTHPPTDIIDETVNVYVIDDNSSIPDGAPLATPDEPNFVSQYPMEEGTDFARQTRAVNVIDGIIITEERRIICYNQPIYDDPCLEPDEYAGLTLGVIDENDEDQTTVLTEVEPLCNYTEILIVDNDRARVGLEQTFFRENEDVGVIELCAVVFEPDIECPIKFPFNVSLITADGSAVETMDYGTLDVILMFDECERRRCVNVSITEDLVDEPDEFFIFHLNRTTGLNPRIELDPVDGIIEIVDDDIPITVGYNPVFYTTTEGQGSVVLNITIFDPPTGGTPQPFTLVVNTQDGTARAGPPDNDYVAVTGQIMQFNIGDTFQTHTIIINNDMECENMPNEEFFSNITFNSGVQSITVINPQAIVTIDDSGEAECIEPSDLVNDTVTGDPLMTVPIYTTPEDTLCYEVHGETDQTFNLISDNCVAVNAHYTRAVVNNPNITLNVIDTIGVRAVATDDTCVNISVNLEGCVAMVNDQPGTVPYQRNGISVRKYNNRVRIVVPNCGETDLVMWVFCTSGSTADPKTNIYYNFDFLRFVVRRGLNLNERSHGLIGQFWNIRIDVQEYLGLFNGNIRSDDYNITVRYPGSSPRSFVAIQSSVTWEFEKKPCLYVGNSQAGPLGEDVDPNDSVIEGAYKDYMVESIYSPNFKFAHIDENNCMTK